MRIRFLIPPAVLLVCTLTAAAVTADAASDRHRTYLASAAQLRAQWAQDETDGVPPSSLAPLRAQLDKSSPTAVWWSPTWFSNPGGALLDSLRGKTQTAYSAAVGAQRAQAQVVIAQWTAFAARQTSWLSSDATSAASQWSQLLDAARTPRAISRLMASWQVFLADQRTAVVAAQQAKLEQELASAGGPQAVLDTANKLVAVANDANLDAGNVAALAQQLSDQIASGATTDAIDTGTKLLPAVNALQSLVNLNDQVSGQLRPLYLTVLQAQAEGTPNAASFAAQHAALGGQFQAARTADQINAVAGTIATMQGQLAAELAANQCGHNVGSGKVITMSLSLQEMLFFQDGCVVKATPITTGRPALPTPTGTFSIFYKTSPFEMVSPWPLGSPYYYPPTPVTWVMEFASGGFFIHDAYWESSGSYGPGGEYDANAASHGCVHTPTDVMQWAFSWTPLGTPVIISA